MTEYAYQDEDGDPVLKVVKRELQNGKKAYHQEHWEDGRWVKGGVPSNETVLYDLPSVLETIDMGEDAIWIVEGEKDASNGRMAYGICTTTNPGGAGKWKDHHSRFLKGAEEVYIVWDRDEKGAEHAWIVYESLRRVGIPDIYFRCARYGKDLSDHINEGGRLDNLVKKRPPKPAPKPAKEKKVQSDDELLPAAFQLALLKLQELGPVAIEDPAAHQYNALCPAHDDSDPSLTIRPGSEDDSVAVLVHCFAGCEADAIATALGMRPVDFTKIEQQVETKIERKTEEQYTNLVARQAAMRRLSDEQNRVEKATWSDFKDSGKSEMKMPLEPTKWVVKDWFAYGSTMLLVADAKAGKTRLCMNLMQSLTEDKHFLGQFKTEMPEDGKFLYLNYDMPANQFRQYLHDQEPWAGESRWVVRHLASHQFKFWEPEVFDEFVAWALETNIHFIVFDTFQIASQGYVTDENNNTEVAAWVSEVKRLCEAAKIPNCLITHHRGRTKDIHSRGASAFDAAVTGWWTLLKDKREEHNAPRTLQATARFGGQSAIELVYELATDTYKTEGKAAGASDGAFSVVKLGKYADYCKALKVWSDEHDGRWPRGNVARDLIVGSMPVRLEIQKEAVDLDLVEHVIIRGRSYEVRLLEDGVSAMNLGGS